MATKDKLHTNDPNLILARAIGTALESDSSFKEISDPLIDLCMVYKEREITAITHSKIDRDLIWDYVQIRTKKATRSPILPIFTQSSIYAWASAAVLLIAAFIGYFWLESEPSSTLIASSNTETLVVTLDDGSLVKLRPHSELYRTNKETGKRAYSLNGEAFFSVVTNPNNPFSVSGTKGTVTVLGTKFNISTWGETDIVYLEEGKILFKSNLNDDELILSPGQSSQIKEEKIDLLSHTSGEQYIDWISETLIFNGNTPNEVINEINQHYGVIINIDRLKNHSKIKGSLKLESLTQTLDNLGVVLGGTFKKIQLINMSLFQWNNT